MIATAPAPTPTTVDAPPAPPAQDSFILLVVVTQDDVDNGRPWCAQRCPVARAVLSGLPDGAQVDVQLTRTLVHCGGKTYRARHPRDVDGWIYSYDHAAIDRTSLPLPLPPPFKLTFKAYQTRRNWWSR